MMQRLVLAAAALLLTACASSDPRKIQTDAELAKWAAEDTSRTMAASQDAVDRMIVRAEKKFAVAGGAQPVLDFLALSGGGDFGAFGAGFLVGWGQVTDPQWKRPEFDAVTGVSTGALIAPFAFIGTDEACLAVEEFYRNPKEDWVRDRGWLFFLPSNPSFMAIKGLERDVRTAIDARRFEQIVQGARDGRALLVSATDLDLGRQKVWNVSVEAQKDGSDPDRVRRMLLASAAIPAIFPPVEIDGGIYADGGVTANVLLRLAPRNPDGVLQQWKTRHPDRPIPRVRYWVIINNQTAQPAKTVQRRWPSIMSPSLATAIRSATMAEVKWLAAEADYTNAVFGTNIEVRVVAIPNDWRPPTPGDFKPETMASLADLGRKLGADPKSWSLWTTTDHTAPGVRGR